MDESRIPDLQQEHSEGKQCFFCKAEGSDKKKCTRCGLISYCNKECQRRDFERHKLPCEHVGRFHAAKAKIGFLGTYQLLKVHGYKDISCFLGSIPDLTRYSMLDGPRMCVLVEIVEVFPTPILSMAKVRDIENRTTEIIFNTLGTSAQMGLPIFFGSLVLANLLKPGNFILLLNIFWRFHQPKAATLMVENLQTVKFIEMTR